MQHVLYGSRGSGSASIEVGLRLCELPYEVVNAATWEPDSALAELTKLNPLHQIPTLVLPDGTVLTESAAILIHLGLAHPASGLLPDGESARAQALRGLVFIAANCYSAISIGDYPERWTTDSTPEAQKAVRQAARKQLHRHWEIFADAFQQQAESPYLFGNRLSALDVMAAVVSSWSGARKHLAAQRPAFNALIQRVQAHPVVAGVWAEHWPG